MAEVFWLQNWYADAGDFVDKCEVCQRSDRTHKTFPTPLIPVEMPEHTCEKIAVDIKGPLILEGRPKFLLVPLDYYSE